VTTQIKKSEKAMLHHPIVMSSKAINHLVVLRNQKPSPVVTSARIKIIGCNSLLWDWPLSQPPLASSGSAFYASRQVDAAIEANGITREAFTSVQRAFVTVSSFETPVRFGSGFASETKYWWFIPNIKNSWNTPTKSMRYFITATCPAELDIGVGAHMSIVCDFTRRPEPIDPEDLLKRPDFKDKASAAILGPQTAIPLTGIGITEKSVRAIQKGFPLFVWGIVYYNDIFPKSQLHVTKFCYQVGASISDKKEIVLSYDFCKHWNCADDECKTDRETYDAEIANSALAPQQAAPVPPQPTPE
jgi:hypothetical protein